MEVSERQVPARQGNPCDLMLSDGTLIFRADRQSWSAELKRISPDSLKDIRSSEEIGKESLIREVKMAQCKL